MSELDIVTPEVTFIEITTLLSTPPSRVVDFFRTTSVVTAAPSSADLPFGSSKLHRFALWELVYIWNKSFPNDQVVSWKNEVTMFSNKTSTAEDHAGNRMKFVQEKGTLEK